MQPQEPQPHPQASPRRHDRRRRRDPQTAEAIYRRLSGGRAPPKYDLASKSLRTWRRYDSAERLCERVANDLGISLFPTDAAGNPVAARPDDIRRVFEAIVDEYDGVVGSLTVAIQALKVAHELRSWPTVDWGRLRTFMRGVRRVKGAPQRKAEPLLIADLESMLDRIDGSTTRGAHEGALLATHWYGALRSDEAVTLAWNAPGLGKGFISTPSRAVEIHLDRSKTDQEGAGQDVTIPAEQAPLVRAWLDRWARIGGREPGRLVFTQISRSGRILGKPMEPQAVTRIVRRHVRNWLMANGMSARTAATTAARYRSHSLRGGYAVSAALAGVPQVLIQKHCRHRSAETTARYLEKAKEISGLGLRGLIKRS